MLLTLLLMDLPLALQLMVLIEPIRLSSVQAHFPVLVHKLAIVAGAGDCGIKKIVVDGKELVDHL